MLPRIDELRLGPRLFRRGYRAFSQPRPPSRDAGHIGSIFLAELRYGQPFHLAGEADIDSHQDREEDEGDQGRPLKEEADHDQNECGVLRMADPCIRPGAGQTSFALCLIENRPRLGQEPEASEDEDRG